MSQQQNDGGRMAANAAKLAQLAKGIADTVKGAMAGGLQGAAVAAAKAFAPQLIKIALITLLVLLLIPFIIFFALPSAFFQWPTVNNATISTMTAQAAQIEKLYTKVESYALDEADKIVEELSYGYDDVVTSIDLGGVSRNWLTAICSVMHEQKMGEISERTVRSLVKQNLDYSYTTESYEESTGETDENDEPITETKTRIFIYIWTVTPDVLMEKLGFTAFQKEWAAFLYNNINEVQLIDPSDPDYPGAPLINYGDLVFTDGGRDVVYYNQADERWGNEMYGKTHTIAVAGCGPTALAMVVSSLTETTVTPKEMADWSYENGYVAEGNGSYHALIPNGAEHFGLRVTAVSAADGQQMIDALADGKLIIAIMGPGHFTVSGHFIVVRGVTADGNILVSDPISIRKTGMEWDMRIILSEASRKAVAGKAFWIIG